MAPEDGKGIYSKLSSIGNVTFMTFIMMALLLGTTCSNTSRTDIHTIRFRTNSMQSDLQSIKRQLSDIERKLQEIKNGKQH